MHIGGSRMKPAEYTLDPAVAARVWAVLVEHCGASQAGSTADQFFYHVGKVDRGGLEFRFQGALGFGGKVYLEPLSRWHPCFRATCYAEDETPARKAMLERANSLLAALAAEAAPKCWTKTAD